MEVIYLEILSETWGAVVKFVEENPVLAFGMIAAMVTIWTIETILSIKFSKR